MQSLQCQTEQENVSPLARPVYRNIWATFRPDLRLAREKLRKVWQEVGAVVATAVRQEGKVMQCNQGSVLTHTQALVNNKLRKNMKSDVQGLD
jgi:hypothetical protein